MADFVEPMIVDMRRSEEFGERWLQDRIFEKPALLGLGDLRVIDKERRQPAGGRVDFILADDENRRWYEVEVQLGATDPSHIIRTIEYWDVEKKRYPKLDHVAVLVAENVTARFFNVINLFNGTMPLMAIQIQCVRVRDSVTLVSSRILDAVARGQEDDFQGVVEKVTLEHWDTKINFKKVADEIGKLIHAIDAELELSPTKAYIGAKNRNGPCNFFVLWPRATGAVIDIKAGADSDFQRVAEEGHLDASGYDAKYANYHVKLSPSEFPDKGDAITAVLKIAYDYWFGE